MTIRTDLLTPAEEAAVFRERDRRRENCETTDHLRRRVVGANRAYVVRRAARYARSHRYALDDLIQAGTLGLFRAFEKFDPARGYRFVTYADRWVRRFMQAECLAAGAGVTTLASWEDVPDGGDHRVIAVTDADEAEDCRARVARLLALAGSDRNTEVVRLHYLGGLTVDAVAARLGITSVRARTLLGDGLARLRRLARLHCLEPSA